MKNIFSFVLKYKIELGISTYLLGMMFIVNPILEKYDNRRPNWDKGKDYVSRYDEAVHIGNMLGDTNQFFLNPADRIPLGNDSPGISEIWIAERSIPISYNLELRYTERNIAITYGGIGKYQNFCKLKATFNQKKYGYGDEQGNTIKITFPVGKSILYAAAYDLNDSMVYQYKPLHLNFTTSIGKSEWYWPIAYSLFLTPLLFLLYRIYRNRQLALKEQYEAVEDERFKISADLHDEIGSAISSIQINSALAKQYISKDIKKTNETLDKIIIQSKELADTIGDIVWSLKLGEKQFMTLRTRMINFINNSLGSTDIDYSILIDKKIDQINKNISLRKNLLLILKEAINNTLKHSKATKIDINLKCEGSHIFITISDNGIGFNTSEKRGNGFYHLKARAKECEGELTIISSQNLGTEIKATIPFIP